MFPFNDLNAPELNQTAEFPVTTTNNTSVPVMSVKIIEVADVIDIMLINEGEGGEQLNRENIESSVRNRDGVER